MPESSLEPGFYLYIAIESAPPLLKFWILKFLFGDNQDKNESSRQEDEDEES